MYPKLASIIMVLGGVLMLASPSIEDFFENGEDTDVVSVVSPTKATPDQIWNTFANHVDKLSRGENPKIPTTDMVRLIGNNLVEMGALSETSRLDVFVNNQVITDSNREQIVRTIRGI